MTYKGDQETESIDEPEPGFRCSVCGGALWWNAAEGRWGLAGPPRVERPEHQHYLAGAR